MRGSISELVPDRGFGLISDQDGREYFFHRGALMGVDFEDLAPGIDVEFAHSGLNASKPRGHETSRGVNRPNRSQEITTGTYKKQQTYRQHTSA